MFINIVLVMTVISISINEKLLEEIDALKDEMGFSGRSDIIRTASRMLIDDTRKQMDIKGEVNGVIFLIHKREVEDKEKSVAIMYLNNLEDPEDSEKMGEIDANLLITDLTE